MSVFLFRFFIQLYEHHLFVPVVSTVLPGRKPTEESPDILMTDPIANLPGIKIDGDMNKNAEKRYNNENHSEQNGPTENHNEANSKELTTAEVIPSSSTSHESSENDEKTEDDTNADEPMPKKSDESEQPTQKIEEPTVKIEEKDEKVTSTADPAETKSVEAIDEKTTEKMDSEVSKAADSESTAVDAVTVDGKENIKIETKPEIKTEIKAEIKEETNGSASIDEKKVDEEIKESPKKIPSDAPDASEKPPTPKRARTSDDEDDDIENSTKNHNAKMIRLELDEDKKIDTKPDAEPSNEPIVAAADSQEEKNVLDTFKTDEIDAQKATELLLDVVDSALAAEKESIKDDAKSTDAIVADSETSKVPDETPASVEALKPDEPVEPVDPVTASISADLDFTPDEALNELVSSEILSVIPEQPAEELKMSEEPANIAETATASDEMTVESTDANALEAENAMEAAPIKTDEEQMDVDESNSVDAMDL